jgi:hypothetical protein
VSLLREPCPASADAIDLTSVDLPPITLPRPRGTLTEVLIDHLRRPLHELPPLHEAEDDPLEGDDSALALHLCYELHYRGLPEVDEAWEWEPTLLRERRRLERRVEDRLVEVVGPPPLGLSPAGVAQAVHALATDGAGPSLSAHVAEHGTTASLRELAIHRSAYQLKEADPHTWAIPRLHGRAKAALVDIQIGEYGGGQVDAVHATLFADTMRALGLDDRYGAYVDQLPGITLSTGNLISLFGLHRRWRGALVGHLALFEMCSVDPMSRYAAALRRLGFGPGATRFYDEHVVADERHQVVALDDLVGGLMEDEPELGGEVVHGARALAAVEAMFAAHVLGAWADGACSLRAPVP